MSHDPVSTVPSIRVRIAYRVLMWSFGFLVRVQRGIRHIDRWLSMPIELVHRPIRILGARYMDVLVNGRPPRRDVSNG